MIKKQIFLNYTDKDMYKNLLNKENVILDSQIVIQIEYRKESNPLLQFGKHGDEYVQFFENDYCFDSSFIDNAIKALKKAKKEIKRKRG